MYIHVYLGSFKNQDRKKKILFWPKYKNINAYFDCIVASSSVKIWFSWVITESCQFYPWVPLFKRTPTARNNWWNLFIHHSFLFGSDDICYYELA